MSSRLNTALAALALPLLAFAAYWPVRHGGLLWDDATTLLGVPAMHQTSGLWAFWRGQGFDDYWPLHYSLLWGEWQLWQQDTLGYHLVSISLHSLNSLLLWRLLRRTQLLTAAAAWAAAALFAVHPVTAEAVAWIVQQKTLQSAAFFFASLYAYVRCSDRDSRHPRLWYGAAVLLFAASLLAKTASLMLPFVLLAYAWAPPQRKARLWKVAPFFLLALLAGLLGLWFHQQHLVYSGGVRSDGFASRLALAARAVWFYLGKALWPLDLAFIYPRWETADLSATQLVPLIALLLTALLLTWGRKRPLARFVLGAMLYNIVILLPCLGFFDISFMKFSLVADHWQYLALIAPIAALVFTGQSLGERAKQVNQVKQVNYGRSGTLAPAFFVLPLGLLLGIEFALTRGQLALYQSDEALWRGTLAKNPACFIAHNNLGQALMSQHAYAEAAAHYAKAAALAPQDSEGPLLNAAEAKRRAGDSAAALAELLNVVARFPNSPLALSDAAAALQQAGRGPEAEAAWRRALALDSSFAPAHQGLALLLHATGQHKAALAEQQLAAALAPSDRETQLNLAVLLASAGKNSEATALLRQLVKTGPDDAASHAHLGFALLQGGELTEAEAELRRALQLDAGIASARQNLGFILAKRGDLAGAIASYQAAAALAPANADVHLVLGLLLHHSGQTKAALQELNEAQKLAPNDPAITRARDEVAAETP